MKKWAILGIGMVLVALVIFFNPFGFQKSVIGQMSMFALTCPGGYQWQECAQWDTSIVKICNKPSASGYPAGVYEQGAAVPETKLGFTLFRACPSDSKVAIIRELLGPNGECNRLDASDGSYCPYSRPVGTVNYWYFKGITTSSLAVGQWSAVYGYYPTEMRLKACGQESNPYTTPQSWSFYIYKCTEKTVKTCLSWETKSSPTKPSGVSATCVGGEVESCGNGMCESAYSETPTSCPADCGGIVPPITPPPDPIMCPAVCVPMWVYEAGTCTYSACGSGCGPNNINTFDTKAECEQIQPSNDTIKTCQDLQIDDSNACTTDVCTDVNGVAQITHTEIADCGILQQYQNEIIVTIIGAFAVAGLLIYGWKKR